jgi:flagellar hook-basal body complex protein FliE
VTLPAIGAVGGVLSRGLAGVEPGGATGAASGASPGLSLGGPAGAQPAGGGAVSGAGEVGGGSNGAPGVEGSGGGETGGFGAALTEAISSLDQSQQSGSSAARALATGTASNPESAVVTVEDAQLAMQLASQIRTKAVEATQQIFQTQV